MSNTLPRQSDSEHHARPASLLRPGRVRAFFWLVAFLVGLFQTWALRHYLSPDGMSYLDLGDAIWQDGWWKSVNGYWSPLYPVLTGLVFRILHPSAQQELPVAHAAGFVIYLGAIAGFDFLLGELWRFQQHKRASDDVNTTCLPEWAWLALAWSFFIWASSALIQVSFIAPDMLVAATVYIASALILRIRRGRQEWLNFILLGLVLGLGYLAKAPMFPLGFVFLGVTFFSLGNWRQAMPRLLVATFVFLLTAAPLVIGLSVPRGRITFGESGRLNYLWYISGLTTFVHWQGDDPRSGVPVHPTRKINAVPAVYEFATPIGGTYPPWYDLSYWHEGAQGQFRLKGLLGILRNSLAVWWDMLFYLQRGFIFLLVIPLYLSWRGGKMIGDLLSFHSFIAPSLVACATYTALNLEPRYICAFVVLLFLTILALIRLPRSEVSEPALQALTLAMLIALALPTISNLGRDFSKGRSESVLSHYQVVKELAKQDVMPGDKVAVIGDSFRAFWARLAKVRIVAEIPSKGLYQEITAGDTESYHAATGEVRARVLEKFAATGARVVITDEPPEAGDAGWIKIGNTKYYLYNLKTVTPATAQSIP